MSDNPPIRQAHPVQDHRQAMENFRMHCSVRGYCGPFINEEFYNAFPDPLWHGYGECVVCCSTCMVAHEELKRKKAEAVVRAVPIGHTVQTPPAS